MMRIILDTNFLLIPFQFGVDIFEEIDRIVDFNYSLAVMKKSLDELNKIVTEGKQRDRSAARMAIKLVGIKEIQMVSSDETGYVDNLIVDLAQKNEDVIVATVDKGLKSRVKEAGRRIITMRQKKYLNIE